VTFTLWLLFPASNEGELRKNELSKRELYEVCSGWLSKLGREATKNFYTKIYNNSEKHQRTTDSMQLTYRDPLVRLSPSSMAFSPFENLVLLFIKQINQSFFSVIWSNAIPFLIGTTKLCSPWHVPSGVYSWANTLEREK
jgi:hypothetical protein